MGKVPKQKEANVPRGSKVEEFKVPSSLPLCADLLYSTRQARLALKEQVEELESRESQLKAHLIATFKAEGSTSVGGKLASYTLVEKEEPVVEDWEALWKYIAKKKAWDMLQKRISVPAAKARWENKEAIPGVGKFKVDTLSMKTRK